MRTIQIILVLVCTSLGFNVFAAGKGKAQNKCETPLFIDPVGEPDETEEKGYSNTFEHYDSDDRDAIMWEDNAYRDDDN